MTELARTIKGGGGLTGGVPVALIPRGLAPSKQGPGHAYPLLTVLDLDSTGVDPPCLRSLPLTRALREKFFAMFYLFFFLTPVSVFCRSLRRDSCRSAATR